MTMKKRKAWLIYWRDSYKNEVKPNNLHVLSARTGRSKVIETAKVIYLNCYLFPISERFEYFRNSTNICISDTYPIIVGGDPSLLVTKVTDLTIEYDDTGKHQIVRWTQPGFTRHVRNRQHEFERVELTAPVTMQWKYKFYDNDSQPPKAISRL